MLSERVKTRLDAYKIAEEVVPKEDQFRFFTNAVRILVASAIEALRESGSPFDWQEVLAYCQDRDAVSNNPSVRHFAQGDRTYTNTVSTATAALRNHFE